MSMEARILVVGMLWSIMFAEGSAGSPPFSCGPTGASFGFCNKGLSTGERVRDLLSRMTLEEKVGQLVNNASAVPRLGVPSFQWWSEGLHGVVFKSGDEGAFTFDDDIGAATSFPQVILTAATFDELLWYKIGKVIGKEGRAMYNEGHTTGMTFWSPNINIFRDPRWGRGQETPGEDPLVNSKYGVSFVRGIQGDAFRGGGLKDGHLLTSACCKHFTAYDLENWNGLNRFTFDAKVTKQDMADTYQPPFRTCIAEGQASGLMCAYNLVNGVPNCADHHLLTTTARGEWGFRGYITGDCGAVSNVFEQQKYAESPEDAVAYVLKAGVDLDCGYYLKNHTRSALEKGKVSEADIDRALYNLFAVRMRLGLFDGHPSGLPYGNLSRKDVCSRENWDLALEAARHGIVLLKNAENLLPLPKTTESLAVIGPNANASTVLLGDYFGPPCKTITPLQGLLSYVEKTKFHSACETINCTLAPNSDALEVAVSAEYVVLVMGLNLEREREELDRADLALPGEQEALVKQIAKAAKNPVILVLLCGGPVDVSFAKNDPKIGSILWGGYPGEAGGKAIAEIIFGDHNPGGRLPMTWYPKDFTGVPMTDMRMRPEPSSGYPGRTYRFYQGKTVFEFGYGLSYSNYSYKFVSVSQSQLSYPTKLEISEPIPVSDIDKESCERAKFSAIVSVRNDGKMAGKHPVLLFLRRARPTNGSPMKQLIGFQTITLNASEEASLAFEVNPCEHFGAANDDGVFVIQPETRYLVVGDQEYTLSSMKFSLLLLDLS